MKKVLAKVLLCITLIMFISGCGNESRISTNELHEKEKFSKIIDNTKIEFNIPDDWHYEELPLEDDYKFALKLYKSSSKDYFTLYYDNTPVGFCGTGRETKEMRLNNGQVAIIGYELGNESWSDISLPTINRNIVLINNGTDEKEVFEIVKTISLETTN